MNNPVIDPKKSALLVIDMQKAFTDPDSPLCVDLAAQTIPAIAHAVAEARLAKISVYWICRRHAADGHDLEEFRKKQLEEAGCPDLLSQKNPRFQLADGLKREKDDKIIYKKRFSALMNTELEFSLKQANIDTLLIAGTQTPNCIRATAMDAVAYGYRTLVLADCTSSKTAAVQNANLKDMKEAGIEIIKKTGSFFDGLNKDNPQRQVITIHAALSSFKRKIWRDIEFPAVINLQKAMMIVIRSFEGDMGHLFCLEKVTSAKNKRSVRYECSQSFNNPYGRSDKCLSDFLLSDLNKDSKYLLTYDYGDDWKFSLTIKKTSPSKDRNFAPRVIKGAGKGIIEDFGGVYSLVGLIDYTDETGDPVDLELVSNGFDLYYQEDRDSYREALEEEGYEPGYLWDYRKFNLDEVNARINP